MVLFTALILFVVFGCLPAAHAEGPLSQIVSLDYPKTVREDGRFLVTVRVAYSSKFGMIDIGIWDAAKGVVIQSLVSNATLSGAGQSTFNFDLTAPSTVGPWRLIAITRVWLQDAWYSDQAGTYDFTVAVVENAILTLDGVPQGSSVRLDGEALQVNGSLLVVTVAVATVHQLEVSSIIAEGPGRRVVFDSWSDGVGSNPRFIVINSNLSISPIFKTQSFLSVNSDFGVGAGQGWYDQGQIAQFGITSTLQDSPAFFSLLTESYKFKSWSGDSESKLPTSSVRMDGPKSVEAKWALAGTSLHVNGVAAVFLFAAILLALKTGVAARRRHRRRGVVKIGCLSVIIPLILISTAFSTSVPVSGQLPLPSAASAVNVGDAYWYYWSHPGSDTCILWLGGGVEYSQGGYLINPYEYESFGTIKFLQELSKYYCVVALAKGPYPSSIFANRTIYQELAQGQFSVATQLHQWIYSQGYKHVFLVGYSVGTDVAAIVATGNPQTWNGSDGLILITAWLSSGIISGAPNLKANLLLLYGHAPNFEPTGRKFYANAPSEGWHGSAYFHKEFRLLDNMGHEVWSPLKDNTYSPIALGITVDFIEKSKALQFGQFTQPNNVPSNGNWTYRLSTIQAPSAIFWDEPFIINATLTSTNPSAASGTVVAYNSSGILALVEFTGGFSATNVQLVMPSMANSSQFSFSLVALQRSNRMWQFSSQVYPLSVFGTEGIVLVVDGLIPNSALTFDGSEYPVSLTGQARIETSKGIHNLEVQANIDQSNVRGEFIRWSDSSTTTSRTLQLDDDTSLTAVYGIQYYVDVTSQFGVAEGSGWYDANSTLEPSVQSPIDSQQSLAFSTWSIGTQSFGLGEPIRISSPMTIEAVWSHVEQSSSVGRLYVALLTASVVLFAVMLIFNLKLTRSRREVGDSHV